MDQDAPLQDAPSLDDIKASFRLLEEECRRFEAQTQQSLQQATSTYEACRAADQERISQKELEINRKEAELHNEKEVLKAAYQQQDHRKRKYESEVQQLNRMLSEVKRMKKSSNGPQVEIPQSAVHPSTNSHDHDRRTPTDHDSGLDSAPDCLSAASRAPPPTDGDNEADGAHGARDSPRAQDTPDRHSFDLHRVGRDDKPDSSEVDVAANDTSSNEDELSKFSDVEETSPEVVKEGDNGMAQSLLLTETTISYDEVYEAVRDPTWTLPKHWIVEYPERCGNWYIVRCLKHNLNWGDKPLPAAGKHMTGREHMCSSKKASLALEKLGERVTGCDQQMAEASNAEYKKALDQGYKPRNIMRQHQPRNGQTSAHRPKVSGSRKKTASSFQGVINPAVGEIYQAWWNPNKDEKSWYLVVILPYSGAGDWEEVGMAGNLFTSGLSREIPKCFKVIDIASDVGEKSSAPRLTWAEGYQDGEPRVRAREFPCLFLHSPLEIPSPDQEFVIGDKAAVLAFRTARNLRHMSTVPPQHQPRFGVNENQGLARDFEARLKVIRDKRQAATGQQVEDSFGVGTLLTHDQERPSDAASVEATQGPNDPPDPPQPIVQADVAEHNTGDDHSKSGNGDGDFVDHVILAPQNPSVGLPRWERNSFNGNCESSSGAGGNRIAARSVRSSPIPTSSTTVRHSDQSKATLVASSAESRPEQAMVGIAQQESRQNVSSTSQRAAYPSQSPEATSSVQAFATPATGEQGPVRGVLDLFNHSGQMSDSAKRLCGSSPRLSSSSVARMEESDIDSYVLGKRQHTNTTNPSTQEPGESVITSQTDASAG
ncbi:hypothetical protein diail_9466 [Diaporthe ilicicola]|nr:hypothetical protein diail_9466 [Diaporthe ilicicola]